MKREEEEEEVGMRRSSRGSKLRVDTQILFEAGPHPGCPYFTRVYGIHIHGYLALLFFLSSRDLTALTLSMSIAPEPRGTLGLDGY